jgi:hypothetical protein
MNGIFDTWSRFYDPWKILTEYTTKDCVLVFSKASFSCWNCMFLKLFFKITYAKSTSGTKLSHKIRVVRRNWANRCRKLIVTPLGSGYHRDSPSKCRIDRACAPTELSSLQQLFVDLNFMSMHIQISHAPLDKINAIRKTAILTEPK